MALEPDQLLRVLERFGGIAVVQVSDRRVHDVEHDDRENLDPPVQRVTVAQSPSAGKPTQAISQRAFDGECALLLGDAHGAAVGDGAVVELGRGPATATSGGTATASSAIAPSS